MKKILLAVFCSLVILGSSLAGSAVAIPEKLDVDKEIVDKVNNLIKIKEENNETYQGFWTMGPRNLIYSKFTIDNGTLLDKIDFITTIFLRLYLFWLPLFRPIEFEILDNESVDFTIEYKHDLPLGNLSRYRYWTHIDTRLKGNSTNVTEIFNEKHTVKVEGFQGFIQLSKRCVLLPPTMIIVGWCDKVTLVE